MLYSIKELKGTEIKYQQWLFKKNLGFDGTIDEYKRRLVGKGYTQKEDEDFFYTYSPVARLTTIQELPSLTASHGLIIH